MTLKSFSKSAGAFVVTALRLTCKAALYTVCGLFSLLVHMARYHEPADEDVAGKYSNDYPEYYDDKGDWHSY